jgi:predicted dehydrogenase
MSGFQKIDYSKRKGPCVGIGVLGYGFMGSVHSNAYVKIPYSFANPAARPVLRAMAGRNEEAVRAAASRFGYEGYYTDWNGLVSDEQVDIVDNCTPDNLHAGPCIAAAEARKHVICEKPLAMTVEDAKAMRDAAEKAGVRHMLCHNYRFLPAVRFAYDLIQEGALGTVYQFRARYLQEVGHDPGEAVENVWYAAGTKSGVLFGIGCHIIDMARFLMGDIVSVQGLEKTYNTKRKYADGTEEAVTADEANFAVVEFANGAAGTLESAGISTGRKNQHTWEINGSKGSIAFDLEDPNHLHVCLDNAPPRLQGFTEISVTGGSYRNSVLYLPPGHNAGWEYGHVHALNHFIDCVVNKKSVSPLGATFEDGYRTQVVMDAVGKSGREGRKIELSYK